MAERDKPRLNPPEQPPSVVSGITADGVVVSGYWNSDTQQFVTSPSAMVSYSTEELTQQSTTDLPPNQQRQRENESLQPPSDVYSHRRYMHRPK